MHPVRQVNLISCGTIDSHCTTYILQNVENLYVFIADQERWANDSYFNQIMLYLMRLTIMLRSRKRFGFRLAALPRQ